MTRVPALTHALHCAGAVCEGKRLWPPHLHAVRACRWLINSAKLRGFDLPWSGEVLEKGLRLDIAMRCGV